MLSVTVFLPLLPALVLLSWRRVPPAVAGALWTGTAAVELVLVTALWATWDGPGIGHETDLPWMPGAGAGYHIGVDGLSLPLLALTALIFLGCSVYSLRGQPDLRRFAALFLALESTCLGLFAALDLILFFLFFDLSLVGMYLVIAGWGHGAQAARSALKFFLYTFVGSLALLLGFIGLFAAATPHTFDMVELIRDPPLRGDGALPGLVLLAIAIGFAVKTPLFPLHTWLPPAHTDAPAAGSAVLAAVLLKMGTYGFLRIAMPMLPGAWRRWALAFVVAGVVSVLYGALVALAQRSFKRMIAYTSVNHMGYILLALGAAGTAGGDAARSVAVSGAVVQMVSHGLLTGALFLLAGVLWQRGGSYDLDSWGGLAGPAPRFAALTAVAAFGSLGLPGLSGFIAEFQIFAGSIGAVPVATGLALPGILLTAGLLLRALHRIFLGPDRRPDGATTAAATDLEPAQTWSVAPLLAVAVLIGVLPRVLLDTVEPAAEAAVRLVSR